MTKWLATRWCRFARAPAVGVATANTRARSARHGGIVLRTTALGLPLVLVLVVSLLAGRYPVGLRAMLGMMFGHICQADVIALKAST
jgi:hypothetical protein